MSQFFVGSSSIVVQGGGVYSPEIVRVTNSVAQSVADSSDVLLSFDTELRDDLNAHDNVTNNSRITIPAGMTLARFSGQVTLDVVAGDDFEVCQLMIVKNGLDLVALFSNAPNEYGSTLVGATANVFAEWIAVTPGDYYELFVRQKKVVAAAVNTNQNFTYFYAEFLP